ncbi:hypothetical protein RUM44_002646 [Polyplax serrata]|uniref:Uncharacterized protein n=1 Tax=Polyplax serrata TaxID=468196 RepID=A0ABR1AFC9_POLSC
MPLDRMLTSKRVALTSVADDSSDDGFPDYRSGVTYDAYPVKRYRNDSCRVKNECKNDVHNIKARGPTVFVYIHSTKAYAIHCPLGKMPVKQTAPKKQINGHQKTNENEL